MPKFLPEQFICRYATRKDTNVGHVVLWFSVARHSAVGCCFHILGVGYQFHDFVDVPSHRV